MNEKDLNIKYICDKTLLNENDELIPIILDMIKESYKSGLCQAEYDNTMGLIEENQELKKQLDDTKDYINKLQATKDKLDKWDYENALQQKEFIKYLEDEKISPVKGVLNSIGDKNPDYDMFKNKLDNYEEILQKYQEIIGVSNGNN